MDPNWQKIKVRIIFGNLSVALPEPKQQVECAIKFFFFFYVRRLFFNKFFPFVLFFIELSLVIIELSCQNGTNGHFLYSVF